jgi:hypothetical protein
MCPLCIGSTVLLLTGAGSTGGLAALVAGRALYRSRSGGTGPSGTRAAAAVDGPESMRASRLTDTSARSDPSLPPSSQRH